MKNKQKTHGSPHLIFGLPSSALKIWLPSFLRGLVASNPHAKDMQGAPPRLVPANVKARRKVVMTLLTPPSAWHGPLRYLYPSS
jgi:hypothetical protein